MTFKTPRWEIGSAHRECSRCNEPQYDYIQFRGQVSKQSTGSHAIGFIRLCCSTWYSSLAVNLEELLPDNDIKIIELALATYGISLENIKYMYKKR